MVKDLWFTLFGLRLRYALPFGESPWIMFAAGAGFRWLNIRNSLEAFLRRDAFIVCLVDRRLGQSRGVTKEEDYK